MVVQIIIPQVLFYRLFILSLELFAKKTNRRNNVEATVFQLSFFTQNNKTRYRGNFKHQLWAYIRALWINLIRIQKWGGILCQVYSETEEIKDILVEYLQKMPILSNKFTFFVENLKNIFERCNIFQSFKDF
jgi:hypothetical protein